MDEQVEAWRCRVAALPTKPRADAAVWALIPWLPAAPLLTAAGAVALTGRSPRAIDGALAQLVEAGACEAMTGAGCDLDVQLPSALRGAMRTSPAERRALITTHTVWTPSPLVPELPLHLATELTPMWAATESFLVDHQMEPPYWAFAWPGSQALARHVLDHPETVSGRRVLDFAAGCGLAAIAAVRAGAAGAVAVEVDPLAGLAITMNAEGNGVTVDVVVEDLLQGPSERVLALVGEGGLLLTGDVCYSRPMAERLIPWLRGAVRLGVEVWIADPGRAYVPEEDVDLVVGYAVPVTRELEDCDVRGTRLLRLRG